MTSNQLMMTKMHNLLAPPGRWAFFLNFQGLSGVTPAFPWVSQPPRIYLFQDPSYYLFALFDFIPRPVFERRRWFVRVTVFLLKKTLKIVCAERTQLDISTCSRDSEHRATKRFICPDNYSAFSQ